MIVIVGESLCTASRSKAEIMASTCRSESLLCLTDMRAFHLLPPLTTGDMDESIKALTSNWFQLHQLTSKPWEQG